MALQFAHAPQLHAALNDAQRAAVSHGDGPLLIIAGAGSGKTQTLAHRVAEILARGGDPHRLLLLTFTRRAAVEMSRRSLRIVGQLSRGSNTTSPPLNTLPWAGTFHAVANKLLRIHAAALGSVGAKGGRHVRLRLGG